MERESEGKRAEENEAEEEDRCAKQRGDGRSLAEIGCREEEPIVDGGSRVEGEGNTTCPSFASSDIKWILLESAFVFL